LSVSSKISASELVKQNARTKQTKGDGGVRRNEKVTDEIIAESIEEQPEISPEEEEQNFSVENL